jgi:hypothetical protein
LHWWNPEFAALVQGQWQGSTVSGQNLPCWTSIDASGGESWRLTFGLLFDICFGLFMVAVCLNEALG